MNDYRLRVPPAKAREKIATRIELGRRILSTDVKSNEEARKVADEYAKWFDCNVNLLNELFTDSRIAEGYSSSREVKRRAPVLGDTHYKQKVAKLRRSVESSIAKLESILDNLELHAESTVSQSEKVFVVHGHDELAKESVTNFLLMGGLEPVILHKQPNLGQTLIEKFERNADVCYAIILLTPDDIGYAKKEPNMPMPRARQNCMLELGYFFAKLGRDRVCALCVEGVDIPSDILGIVYISMDSRGGWKQELVRDIKVLQIEADYQKMLLA